MDTDLQYTNLFIERLRTYGSLSKNAERDLLERVRLISKKKGCLIVKEGQTIPSFFIIRKGLIRSFYKKGEQEVTIWFGYEEQNFATITSFFENKPSRETIECLEDCEFYCISGTDLNELYDKHSDLGVIGRKIIGEYCIILDERIFEMQTMSAEERYKRLLKEDPEIIKRAPLSHIASFLGISQETLSRVRRKW
ncbi:Crp/Fnr family transcriptional regulator [Bacteroides cellulosilyticus]|uniref:Crp/Fnr family transcriptional regulator n=1 Tax=Bacteroides cellulosilyticus TaxID=246787 RepID=UPI0018A09238|nr:Crp/Fnr family transcriptional regulator [Bacteroides cellulosilyticus]